MRLRGLERRLSYFFKPFLVEDPPVLFAGFFTDFLEALLVVFLSAFFAVLAFGFLADFPAVFFLVFLAAFFFGFLEIRKVSLLDIKSLLMAKHFDELSSMLQSKVPAS